MTEKTKVGTEVATEKKNEIELDANEIMRLSVFKIDEEKVELRYKTTGDNDTAEYKAISQVLEEGFGKICIPIALFSKATLGIICESKEDLRKILSKMDEAGKFC